MSDDLCNLFTISTSDYSTRNFNLEIVSTSTPLPTSCLSSPAASTDFDDTGSVVWPVSVLLSQYVVNWYHDRYLPPSAASPSPSGSSPRPQLLELGAGVGLPSRSLLDLVKLVPSLPKPSVVATDGRDAYVSNDGVLALNVAGEKGGNVRKVVWGNEEDVDGLLKGGEGKGEEGERKKVKTLGSDFTSTAPAKKPTIKGEGRENTKRALLKDYLSQQARGGHVNEKSLENWRDITQGEPNMVTKTMKQVKRTINDSYDPAVTWEKLSIRNQDVEEMKKFCNKVVDWVDADVRSLEGKSTLQPGQKSKTVNTVVSIANRIQKVQAGKKKNQAKNTSIVGAFFGGGK
ncbi:hypothetical protein TrCOL_g1743 [Triparma columacea]|uniref:Uncharacterized protein n=1 Tax=Triparma columacea TaxID=722753 RepID=A0A9W7GER2_9STRA|nr:hypothetical protein TrCOL_g1743 [Triparma columacea]